MRLYTSDNRTHILTHVRQRLRKRFTLYAVVVFAGTRVMAVPRQRFHGSIHVGHGHVLGVISHAEHLTEKLYDRQQNDDATGVVAGKVGKEVVVLIQVGWGWRVVVGI